jgi:hypothetical protein
MAAFASLLNFTIARLARAQADWAGGHAAMGRIEKTVFLSYRRADQGWGQAIFQNLTQHGYDVFIDYDGIASGDFETVILREVRARAHFLVLLTPTALQDSDDPKDWMRREIEAAMDSRRNIVPLMFNGFSFGAPAIVGQLTGKLAALAKYNGLEIPNASLFESQMEQLRNRFLNVQIDAVLHPAPVSALKAGQRRRAWLIAGGAVGAAAITALVGPMVAALFAGPPALPEETEIHGWLMPGKEATPPNQCTSTSRPTNAPPLPKNATLFVFGRNGAWTTANGKSTLLQVGNCTLMSVERDGERLAFNADIFDSSNEHELIARIEKNEFHLIPGKYSYQKRSPDRSALTVFDRQGNKLLFIHYVNKSVVLVNGTFACADMTKVVVTDEAAIVQGEQTLSSNCKGSFGGQRAAIAFDRNGFRF